LAPLSQDRNRPEVNDVDRGSDKQAPRLDDEHKHETESFERGAPTPSRVEEHREVEPTEAEEEAPEPEEDQPDRAPAEEGGDAPAPDEPEQPGPPG
jgi:hypothetical protein